MRLSRAAIAAKADAARSIANAFKFVFHLDLLVLIEFLTFYFYFFLKSPNDQAGIPCSDACRCIDCRNVDINGGAIRTSLALPHVRSASTVPQSLTNSTNHVSDSVTSAALAAINAFRSRPLPADDMSAFKPSSALLSWQQTLAAADCSPAWRDVWNSVWQVLQSTVRRPFGHASADASLRRVSAPLTDSKIADVGKALIVAAKSASQRCFLNYEN
jgi:hypothetical protein